MKSGTVSWNKDRENRQSKICEFKCYRSKQFNLMASQLANNINITATIIETEKRSDFFYFIQFESVRRFQRKKG